MLFRRLVYQRKGFRPQALLTSLLDDKTYPATDAIEVYHERWEIELGDDELKTELLEQRESLRSKSVAAVEQEAWGASPKYAWPAWLPLDKGAVPRWRSSLPGEWTRPRTPHARSSGAVQGCAFGALPSAPAYMAPSLVAGRSRFLRQTAAPCVFLASWSHPRWPTTIPREREMSSTKRLLSIGLTLGLFCGCSPRQKDDEVRDFRSQAQRTSNGWFNNGVMTNGVVVGRNGIGLHGTNLGGNGAALSASGVSGTGIEGLTLTATTFGADQIPVPAVWLVGSELHAIVRGQAIRGSAVIGTEFRCRYEPANSEVA